MSENYNKEDLELLEDEEFELEEFNDDELDFEDELDVYTTAICASEDAQEEKQDMVAKFLPLRLAIMLKYKDSKYLNEALAYIDEYFALFADEVNVEHEFASLIITAFDSLEFKTDLDSEIAASLEEELLRLDDIFEYRCEHYIEYIRHLEKILMQNTLTNSNYLFINYPERITENDKKRLLSYFKIN